MATDDLRTLLARLELCSTAPAAKLDTDGGHSSEHPGGKRPPGTTTTAADWYRYRLHLLDQGRPRRVDDGQGGKVRDTYERLLSDARRELEQITGRTDRAPERRTAPMDTREGVQQAARQDAPGKPADQVARQFGVTEFTVRRWYVEWQLDPLTGEALSDAREDRSAEVARLAAQGMGERSIALALGIARGTVRKALGKAA